MGTSELHPLVSWETPTWGRGARLSSLCLWTRSCLGLSAQTALDNSEAHTLGQPSRREPGLCGQQPFQGGKLKVSRSPFACAWRKNSHPARLRIRPPPSPTGCGSPPGSAEASRLHRCWCGTRLQVLVPYMDARKRGDVELLPQGHVGAGWGVDLAGWLRHCPMSAGSEPPSEVTRVLPFLNCQPWTKGSLCKAGSAAHRPGPLLLCDSWCFPGFGTTPTRALRTLRYGYRLQPVSWLTSELPPVSSPPRASWQALAAIRSMTKGRSRDKAVRDRDKAPPGSHPSPAE